MLKGSDKETQLTLWPEMAFHRCSRMDSRGYRCKREATDNDLCKSHADKNFKSMARVVTRMFKSLAKACASKP